MKMVNFTQIKDELINNMRRKMLIPVIGSGFTRGCDAYKGKVPSGKDYSEYMIKKIAAHLSLTQAELDSLKSESFSNISDTYHRAIPISLQKEYLKFNFTKVKLEDSKRKVLELSWPYVYTLNIDDGIESNSCYQHIVYSNRPVETVSYTHLSYSYSFFGWYSFYSQSCYISVLLDFDYRMSRSSEIECLEIRLSNLWKLQNNPAAKMAY